MAHDIICVFRKGIAIVQENLVIEFEIRRRQIEVAVVSCINREHKRFPSTLTSPTGSATSHSPLLTEVVMATVRCQADVIRFPRATHFIDWNIWYFD